MENAETYNLIVITNSVKEELHSAASTGSNQDDHPLLVTSGKPPVNKNTNVGNAGIMPSTLRYDPKKSPFATKLTTTPRLRSSTGRIGHSTPAAAVPGPSTGLTTRNVAVKGKSGKTTLEVGEMGEVTPRAKKQRVSGHLERETGEADSSLSRIQSTAEQIFTNMKKNRQTAAAKLFEEDPDIIMLQNLYEEMGSKLIESSKTKKDEIEKRKDAEKSLTGVHKKSEELNNEKSVLQLKIKDLEIIIQKKENFIESQDHLRDSLATTQKNLTDREGDLKDWKAAYKRLQADFTKQQLELDKMSDEMRKLKKEKEAESERARKDIKELKKKILQTFKMGSRRTEDELVNLELQEEESLGVEIAGGEEVNITS